MSGSGLDTYERVTFTHDGATRDVYRRGSGPAVIVMAEIPGITPNVIGFADRVVAIGCTAVMPHLFGHPGREIDPDVVSPLRTVAYGASSMIPACISREFTVFATGRTSPVVAWLRALAASEHERCGGPGVGAVGMCFTGGYALAMATDDRLLVPVMSQPSLPLAVTAKQKRSIDLSPADLDRVRHRCAHDGLEVIGLRFTTDRFVPAERFARLRDELGDAFLGIELPPEVARQGTPQPPHSVLTEHLVDEEGEATRDALDLVLDHLHRKLVEPTEATEPGTPGKTERGEVVWRPATDGTAGRRLRAFQAWLADHGGPATDHYDDLWRWSIDDLEGFWSACTEWSGVRWHDRPERALVDGDRSLPGARWFPGGTLNYAEHALAHAEVDPDGLAVIAESQTRERTTLTWAELADSVARCRAGLARLEVGRGDRVVAYAPNIPETLVAFLATVSLGATWASCPPEFGVRSVVDRLTQIEPSVLVAVDGYRYGSRAIDRRDEVASIVESLPSLRHVVHVPYLQPQPDEPAGTWADLLSEPGPSAFEPVPFDHPLYVLFSSGTTGLPKPIVHGHGGITAEHLKVLALHHDLGPGDRFAWFTTTGWMMWNFLISGLLVGATVVLFDGDPASPDLSTLWRLAADERLDLLGLGAPMIMAARKAGLTPGTDLDLSALRSVGSTGAPLPPAGFRWIRDAVGPHVQPNSISGGTDVCSAFVGAVPTIEVRAGEITRALLGCDVRAVDGDGNGCPPDVTGELVVAAPMPSMPVGFWGDDDGSRLRAAYFEDHPGVWTHGDWITLSDDGSCTITGRSDATLNRGGVRLGTSDFYAVVESFPEVDDSVVVHLDGTDDDPMGELLLFVQLHPGAELDDDLRARLGRELRTQLSPRHVPDRVAAVPLVPRTLSGKKLEVPVKRVLLGADVDAVASRGSLADPTALDHYAALRG